MLFRFEEVVRAPWMWIPVAFFATAGILIAMGEINEELFVQLNLIAANIDSLYWPHVTNLGDGLIAAMLVFPFIRKKPELIWAFFFAALFTALFCQGIKEITAVSRPPAVLPEDLFNIIGPAYKSRAFPSGHTATIATAGCIVVYGLEEHWAKISLIMVVVLTGFSRISLGVHWPVDVAAGLSLGWVCGIFGLSLRNVLPLKRKQARLFLYSLFSLATVVGVLIYRTPYEGTAWTQTLWILLFFSLGTKELYRPRAYSRSRLRTEGRA